MQKPSAGTGGNGVSIVEAKEVRDFRAASHDTGNLLPAGGASTHLLVYCKFPLLSTPSHSVCAAVEKWCSATQFRLHQQLLLSFDGEFFQQPSAIRYKSRSPVY